MTRMVRFPGALFAALFVVFLTISPDAVAQTPEKPDLSSEQKEEVGQLLLEAKRAYGSKDYEVALDRLVKAYALYPDANVQRRIGETLERLRKDREALDVYRRVLARDDVEPSTRSAVKRRVTFLEDLFRSRQAMVSVTSPSPDTMIWVDDEDEPRGTAPVDIRLDPGPHTLRAESAGKDPLVHEIRVSERERVAWHAEWTTTAEEADPVAPPGEDYSTIGWVSVGLGATVLGAAAVTSILAADRASTLDDYDALRQEARPADYSDVESEYNTLVLLSWTGAGLGALFTAVGVYLLVISDEEVSDESTARIDVSPTAGGAHVQWSITW